MTPPQALKAIQEAFAAGRYVIDPHAHGRMKQRKISFHDIKKAVMNAQHIESYADPKRAPAAGATSWRLQGADFDGDLLNVGVDVSRDHLGTFALVVTVF